MRPEEEDEQSWPVYLAAGGVIAVIGAAAFLSVRRNRSALTTLDAE
jgi:LPXTG-motif cell wall-anchored protein